MERDAVVTTTLVPYILFCDAGSLWAGLDKVPDPKLLHHSDEHSRRLMPEAKDNHLFVLPIT
jgi:hypothetical protein